MKTRIITGTILAIVLGLLIYFGEGELRFLFDGFCVLLSGLASYEFVRMSKNGKDKFWYDYLPVLLSVLLTILSIMMFGGLEPHRNELLYKYFFIFLAGMLLIETVLFVTVEKFSRQDIGNQFLTVLYCSLGFIAFAYLRFISINAILYLLIVTMVTDVFAYFIGVTFGKHRLAPKISPKKSVEGFFGGLLFGAGFAILFGVLTEFPLPLPILILVSIALSIIAQVGDLIASKFKREAGIKDYSKLLPGHGGILDRFDSSSFTAIFLFIVFILMMR